MDKKISQLTAATTPLTGSELIPVVQSGQTVKATIDDIRGYKVYTALLTQSGGDAIYSKVEGDDIYKGITYTILTNSENADLTIYGAPNSNIGTSFVCSLDATLPSDKGSIELQFNGGAPVVTVLENTIGNIWFTYNTTGTYLVNSNGLFTTDKTAVLFGGIYFNNDISANIGWGYNYLFGDQIAIYSTIGDINQINGALTYKTIEIRVYN